MINHKTLARTARRLAGPLKAFAKTKYRGGERWAHPDLKRIGTVQDLYYWVADGNLDTLLLLQNYFSVLYPALNTDTAGVITIYDENGGTLGSESFSVGHNACARFNVSSLLKALGVNAGAGFGTLEVNLSIPSAVLDHIKDQPPFYFWDRFYIGYTTSMGQTCFVHGVDRTHIYQEGQTKPVDWYKTARDYQWAPETPVDIGDYKTLSVIMINRTSRSSDVTLTLLDTADESLSWNKNIPPKGVRRFELTPENTAGLEPVELRMRVKGMTTQYGRPVLFKEFNNGAISAMHC